MVDVLLRSSDHLRRGNGLVTAGTACAKPSREVLFAEDLTTSGVALVGELYVAVCALEALGVPRLVQDLQDEPIDNGTVAASTDRDVSGTQLGGLSVLCW